MPRTEQELLTKVYERSAEITKRRRLSVAAISVASLALVVLVFALRPSEPGSQIIRPIDQPARPAATERPDDRPRKAIERETDPDDASEPAPSPAAGGGKSGSVSSRRACGPVLTDDVGDAKDTNLDIRSGSITSGAEDGVITFTYDLRDLTGIYSSTERREWDMSFTWEERRYTVRAAHADDPLGSAETFEIHRETQRAGASGERSTVVAQASGTIDNDTDRITIDLDIDSFNDNEAAVSRSEGRDAPSLGTGSVLTDFAMITRTSKLAADAGDTATGSCDYTLE